LELIKYPIVLQSYELVQLSQVGETGAILMVQYGGFRARATDCHDTQMVLDGKAPHLSLHLSFHLSVSSFVQWGENGSHPWGPSLGFTETVYTGVQEWGSVLSPQPFQNN
jgi:hypothetical protein